eukprot:CAMPEP_0171712188 /NCGR_PEP_ID=MMETSP0991-20121206/17034_1 /TAXON_ID=483369 /ORGANISM="non described non described, Strain CCMP2098" /LENGTH=163 /DNA_ID=CAMNT_0012302657 /DNA_START=106 /DNA_END=597 /DNA_ORIENTATION=-
MKSRIKVLKEKQVRYEHDAARDLDRKLVLSSGRLPDHNAHPFLVEGLVVRRERFGVRRGKALSVEPPPHGQLAVEQALVGIALPPRALRLAHRDGTSLPSPAVFLERGSEGECQHAAGLVPAKAGFEVEEPERRVVLQVRFGGQGHHPLLSRPLPVARVHVHG